MQNTAILCIDIWSYHHCKSLLTKINNLVKKLNPFLEQCHEKSIPIIHMHDVDLRNEHLYLRKNIPSFDLQNKYHYEATINPDISEHFNRIRVGDISIDDKNIEYPFCAKSSVCECDYNRSCFLEKYSNLKKNMKLYLEKSTNIHDLINYCIDNYNECQFGTENPYIHPKLLIFDSDIYLDNLYELYAYLIENNIKNIIYVGSVGNICISWSRQYSMYHMKKLGFNTYFIKDYIVNMTGNMFNPETNIINSMYTEEYFNNKIFDTLEKYYGKSIHQTDVFS